MSGLEGVIEPDEPAYLPSLRWMAEVAAVEIVAPRPNFHGAWRATLEHEKLTGDPAA